MIEIFMNSLQAVCLSDVESCWCPHPEPVTGAEGSARTLYDRGQGFHHLLILCLCIIFYYIRFLFVSNVHNVIIPVCFNDILRAQEYFDDCGENNVNHSWTGDL